RTTPRRSASSATRLSSGPARRPSIRWKSGSALPSRMRPPAPAGRLIAMRDGETSKRIEIPTARTIPGFEGYVMTADQQVYSYRFYGGGFRRGGLTDRPRLLHGGPNASGNPRVWLRRDGEDVGLLVSKLHESIFGAGAGLAESRETTAV